MKNFNRLWAVVNSDTSEVIYSSFDFQRAKAAYDKLIQPIQDEKYQYVPNIGDMFKIRFCRYDINVAYLDDTPRISPFQKSLNDDFRAFIDFCLLKRGKNNNNNTNTNKDNYKC